MYNEIIDNGSVTARYLRIISVCTFLPALIFNIAHGVAFTAVLPALGLIPHAFSVALASYELGWWALFLGKSKYKLILQDDQNEHQPSSWHTFIIMILDAGIGLALTGCTVGAYFLMESQAGWWRYSGHTAMAVVGTYATLPYITNA
jgi:hypothetical protein